jgi:hypothetical protein
MLTLPDTTIVARVISVIDQTETPVADIVRLFA